MKDKDIILDSINSDVGRFLIGEKGKEKIVKVTPNAYHKLLGFQGKRPILQAIFSPYNRIEQIFAPIIEKQRIASDKYLDRILQDKYKSFLHFAGLEKSKYLPQIYLTTTTYNTVSGGAGYLYVTSLDTWQLDHDAANAESLNTAVAQVISSNVTGAANSQVMHTASPFDTSSLGAGVAISSAFIRCPGTSVDSRNAGEGSVDIVTTTEANTSSLALADFSKFNTTSYGTIAYGSLNAAGDNDFTITDLTQISKTAVSKFGVMLSSDRTNTAPIQGNHYSFVWTLATMLLSVTYTLPATGGDENAYFL